MANRFQKVRLHDQGRQPITAKGNNYVLIFGLPGFFSNQPDRGKLRLVIPKSVLVYAVISQHILYFGRISVLYPRGIRFRRESDDSLGVYVEKGPAYPRPRTGVWNVNILGSPSNYDSC